jgi:DNA-binding transcriptional MerR regulator
MKIGQLAATCGISAEALRYYEKIGLLRPAARAANGYRSYGEADVAIVRFIRSAQSMGFTLAEIASTLPRIAEGNLTREDVERQLLGKMAALDEHIARLTGLRGELQRTLGELRCTPGTPLALGAVTRS